jgi:hypothetical protein
MTGAYILPLSMALSRAALMPILLIVRRADVDTFKVTNLFISGTQKRFVCKLGLNLRLVFLFEKETWFPVIAFFPVKSQMRAIFLNF